ncbi:hypothetical protein OGAPHI_001306 [Ogataea philodendri]|uniref:Uncharacterized protein n=1 Tax=Ogataea philodendri TaxID=1378263 RepID=A0A9P8T9Y7_9ASCO|nr:uncharacterized protein OGAPHI_001306 [Ogataea philodendri]KAH3670790.1 hypothetical protein OGAPHI_001306 [Ogataea philodendri]
MSLGFSLVLVIYSSFIAGAMEKSPLVDNLTLAGENPVKFNRSSSILARPGSLSSLPFSKLSKPPIELNLEKVSEFELEPTNILPAPLNLFSGGSILSDLSGPIACSSETSLRSEPLKPKAETLPSLPVCKVLELAKFPLPKFGLFDCEFASVDFANLCFSVKEVLLKSLSITFDNLDPIELYFDIKLSAPLAVFTSSIHDAEWEEKGSEQRHAIGINTAWNKKYVAYQTAIIDKFASLFFTNLPIDLIVSEAALRQILLPSLASSHLQSFMTSGSWTATILCQINGLNKIICMFLYLQISLFLDNENHSGNLDSSAVKRRSLGIEPKNSFLAIRSSSWKYLGSSEMKLSMFRFISKHS